MAAWSSRTCRGSAGSSSGCFLPSCTSDEHTIAQVSRDLLDAIWSFLFTFGQRGPKKPPKLKLKWGGMNSTSFSVLRENVQTRSDLRKSPTKSLCLGK